MSRGTTTAKWSLTVVGGAIVVALQTPPDTAVTNAALWVEKITGYLPDLPPWADAFGTVVGILIALTPLLLWLRKRWRRRMSIDDLHVVVEPAPQSPLEADARARTRYEMRKLTGGIGDPVALGAALLEDDAKRAEAEANRKNELAAKRARVRQTNDWMPFHAALHYLVYQSQWAEDQPAAKDAEEFDRIVAPEVRERLARGEIESRGKRGLDKDALQRATEPIPAEFWVSAFLQPHGEIALADDDRSFASTAGTDKGPQYRGVILKRSDVEQAWPSRTGSWPTPLSRCVESVRAQCEAARGKGSVGQRDRIAAAAQAIDDELREEEAKALDRLGAILPPDKIASIKAGVSRDVRLPEALGWIVYGEWEKPFHGTPFTIALSRVPIGALLAEVVERAGNGRLTVWGKESDGGVFKRIPRTHWEDHSLALADLFGGTATTGADPYRDLMFSRRELEREWPHEQ